MSQPREANIRELHEEERIQVRTLFWIAKWTTDDIAEKLGYSSAQAFLDKHIKNREVSWEELWPIATQQPDNYEPTTIERNMGDLGYKRKVWRRNIKLTHAERNERIRFARECLEKWPREDDWIEDGIRYLLFNGMALINDHRKWNSWTTFHQCENASEWERVQEQSKGRFMIWGCFSGKVAGRHYVWEAGNGNMTPKEFVDHILSRIELYTEKYPGADVQVDRTKIQTAEWSRGCLDVSRMLTVLEFPPNSPDLDLMQDIWDWMRVYLYDTYNINGPGVGMEDIKIVIDKTWHRLPQDILEKAARSMPSRLRWIIDNDGEVADKWNR
ncbi:hypothetical protein K449DRAFT_439778 [Hypoxylon sp. EC38]|nr:hypothetical protein K449DRAFT_439778 [Hypoxylon sp. EC38]